MTKPILVSLFVFAVLLVATSTAQSAVEPIWLSPTSIGRVPVVFPERGVWSNISTGVGSNSGSWILLDSKQTLWIILGLPGYTRYTNAVWNYDPKTDLYRWVAGFNDTLYHDRVPGQLRVPSPDNWPGFSRLSYEPVTIDHNDNIWFTPAQVVGELWLFNTTSFMFVRMKGLFEDETDFEPRYGTPGEPSDDVWPGYTTKGCLAIDSNNNLWQIGGFTAGSSFNNRAWHFNTTSFQWTFIAGNTTDNVPTVYGDNPLYGSRFEQSCDIDDDDRIWLFGGHSNQGGRFNDVWSFDTRTAQWRLEREATGNITDPLFNKYYPNATVAVSDDFDPRNNPYPSYLSSFTDRKDGTLLLIGGDSSTGIGTNDVWLFNKTLKQWKLIYGDPFNTNNTGNFSNYRTPGSVMNGRLGHGATKGLNINGDVFILGGPLNDLWLIPQQQCNYSTANKCSSNAQCIEEMIGYSCKCKEGFTGDGFTCVGPPATPIADVPATPSESPVTPPVIDDSQSPSISPSPSSQPSSTPHRNTRVSRATIVESSLLLFGIAVLLLAALW